MDFSLGFAISILGTSFVFMYGAMNIDPERKQPVLIGLRILLFVAAIGLPLVMLSLPEVTSEGFVNGLTVADATLTHNKILAHQGAAFKMVIWVGVIVLWYIVILFVFAGLSMLKEAKLKREEGNG